MMAHKYAWMQDEKMKQYFDGLPAFVQENIMQTSVPFNTYDELVRCADNIRGKQNDKQ